LEGDERVSDHIFADKQSKDGHRFIDNEPVSMSGLTALEEVERHIKLCGPDPYVKIGIDHLHLIRAALSRSLPKA
jgi:hypothetical protein